MANTTVIGVKISERIVKTSVNRAVSKVDPPKDAS